MVAICSILRAQVTGYTTGLTWEAGASSIRFQLSSFSSGNVAVLLQSKRGWLPGALRGGGDFGKSSNDWRIYWDQCGILFINIYVIIHAYIYIHFRGPQKCKSKFEKRWFQPIYSGGTQVLDRKSTNWFHLHEARFGVILGHRLGINCKMFILNLKIIVAGNKLFT